MKKNQKSDSDQVKIKCQLKVKYPREFKHRDEMKYHKGLLHQVMLTEAGVCWRAE